MKTMVLLSFIGFATAVFAAEQGMELPLDQLTDQYLGRTVTIRTNEVGIVVLGSAPPRGMISMEDGKVVYRGRLDGVTSEWLKISASDGPDYRKPAEISKKEILQVKVVIDDRDFSAEAKFSLHGPAEAPVQP